MPHRMTSDIDVVCLRYVMH